MFLYTEKLPFTPTNNIGCKLKKNIIKKSNIIGGYHLVKKYTGPFSHQYPSSGRRQT